MSRPGFLSGALLAFALALAGSIVHAGLGAVLPPVAALEIVITGLSGAYVGYLLHRSRVRTGRVATAAAWVVLAGAAAWLAPGTGALLVTHVLVVWLIRSLYFHAGVLAALADLTLSAFALASAVWAAGHSGSLFLAVWSFFLVQALFTAIPARPPRADAVAPGDAAFRRAHRTAAAALERLTHPRQLP